jgi:TRAP-type C4-dicarboxylate transport system substrate-binding protein
MKFTVLRSIFQVFMMLALIFSLTACGSDKSDSSGSDSKSSAPPVSAGDSSEAAKDLGTFEFSLSMHDPVTSNNGKFYQAWADEINKATNGHVTITIYGSGSLAAAPDVGEMVETGGVDIGWIFTSFYAGQFPLTDVTTLPMVGFGDSATSTKVLWDLYEKYKELRAEWKNYKLLNLYGNPGMLFASNKSPVKSPEDLQGLVMRTPAGPITTLVTDLGASPVVMAPPHMYEALQKNNINGYVFEPAGITNFKLEEVTKYVTDMPLYDGAFGLVMNWDKWNSLPPEYQKVFEETTQKSGSLAAAQNFSDAATAAHKTMKDAGVQWVTVSDEARARFQKAADVVIAAWPETVKVENFDIEAYMKDALSLAAKYGE